MRASHTSAKVADAQFQSFPLGDPVNGSPHSVCVSLPRLDDVIAYEEKDPRVLDVFAAGYPRFFKNPLISELTSRWTEQEWMQKMDPLLPTHSAALDLCAFLSLPESAARPVNPFWTVRLENSPALIESTRAYLQHTGSSISSREAEAVLVSQFGLHPFTEERPAGTPAAHHTQIRQHLHQIYGTASLDDIHLFRSGMNAFYAGFRALQSIQLQRGRDLWLQLGWLYVDTTRVLERFALPGADPIQVFSVLDFQELRDLLSEEGHRVAGIVTEVPTNPLVQTPDLQQLRGLADKYKAALILDPTLVSPHNVNILPYADLHINSLTKYAAAAADVMMGALALNPDSAFYDDLHPLVDAFGLAPGEGDLARMAAQISGYEQTIRHINASTTRVAEFLMAHPQVQSVHWAHAQPSAYNYNWLQHLESGPGCIISFSLRKPLREFYDPSRLVKSPSFGARFTMMCPFMYLAHYDLVKSPEGRKLLLDQGIHPDLVRLSIGLEPVDAIIAELDRTLRD